MPRNVQLNVLRGVFAAMPILGSGELYFATDIGALYVGPVPTLLSSGVIQRTQAIVDFGELEPTEDTTARVTVNASWVVATSELFCCVVEGQDHTDDEIAAERITATIGNIQPGTSFDVVLSSMNGSSGKFLVNVGG